MSILCVRICISQALWEPLPILGRINLCKYVLLRLNFVRSLLIFVQIPMTAVLFLKTTLIDGCAYVCQLLWLEVIYHSNS